MINFYNQVPSVYTSISRDFQYLSWLINIVLNSVKHNVDGMYDLPNQKADPKITELLAMTLGFKIKRNYDQSQLNALVSIIPRLLKYKGTEHAAMMAARAMVNATGNTGEVECSVENNCLEVVLPKDLVDVNLFMDILPYILPAGITCKIVRQTKAKLSDIKPINVQYHDVLHANWHKDISWDDEQKKAKGLGTLFDVDANAAAAVKAEAEKKAKNVTFASYLGYEDVDANGLPVNLNAGLLSNSTIPSLFGGDKDSPILFDQQEKEEEN